MLQNAGVTEDSKCLWGLDDVLGVLPCMLRRNVQPPPQPLGQSPQPRHHILAPPVPCGSDSSTLSFFLTPHIVQEPA